MSDVIYRQDAIDAICEACYIGEEASHTECKEYQNLDSTWCEEIVALRNVPSAEPEIKPISYQDCSNAMLMMWMDNVITDGEYNRIMDKLNAKHMAERRTDDER